MNKPLNFIRNQPDYSGGYEYDLTVQLPVFSKENIRDIAQPLVDEIGGDLGLAHYARFRWQDVERVQAYFEELGYEIQHSDEREIEEYVEVNTVD
ncbi:MAG: hypothetical protein KDI79_00690 [Anaerolineae bacterium]|nr:hypothetical protein [Anaerolineae bacterium]